MREVLALLRRRGVPTAILTRNTRESVDTVLAKHDLAFDVIITADDALAPKPSPEPVRHIATALGVHPRETMVVGDFRFDVESGRAAGAMTVFLRTNSAPGVTPRMEFGGDNDGSGADFIFDGMDGLLDLLRETT